MESVNQKKVHKILDRPILSTILLLVFAVVLTGVLQLPKYFLWGTDINGTMQYLYDIAESFVLLLAAELIFTKVWFKGEFEGTLKGDLGYGFRLLIPVLVVEIVIFVFERIIGVGNLNNILFVLSLSVTAGIVEEVTFRSLVVANLMRIAKTYKGMITTVAATSLIFGAVHMTNLLQGANLGSTISQLFSATIMGIFFAAVYLACGSILPAMALHFLNDVFALLFLKINESGATTEGVTLLSTVENLLLDLVLLVIAFGLLRPGNYEKIRRVWDEKWSISSK